MVTSKPKRISVAAGLVHIIFLLKEKLKLRLDKHKSQLNKQLRKPIGNFASMTTSNF